MFVNTINKAHFVGVGGSGMSALAALFAARNIAVSGSDTVEFDAASRLRASGITVSIGHIREHVANDLDLLVYSSAVPEDNIERVAARKQKIKELSYTQALGMVMRDYPWAIAVSGTNGKTTTTSLLGVILAETGMDPTVIVGGSVSAFGGNFRAGGDETFVVEGCEYQRNMLSLVPNMIVLTNIEEDHLDYYHDIDDIIDAFTEYVGRLTKEGVLVYNADDGNVAAISHKSAASVVSYGIVTDADFVAKNISMSGETQTFSLVWRGNDLGTFRTPLPGRFNIYNILAASAVALYLGVDADALRRAVALFTGAGRRFERHIRTDGKIIISDYAHHPTALAGTIEAAESIYPGKRFLVVFQPHQKDRTIKLFDEFVTAIAGKNETILAEIYEVAGRNGAEKEISSRDLVVAVKKRNSKQPISYTTNIKEAATMITDKLDDFDVVLIMGAGDIYQVAQSLQVIV